MRCRTAKWFPICVLFVSSSLAYIGDSDIQNVSDRHDNLTDYTVQDGNNFTNQNVINNPDVMPNHDFNKRSSNEPRIEPRLHLPVLAAPRPRPSYGLPSKGYTPSKPIGYPAARPPPVYRPQQRPPSNSYGPPKPTGYPASSSNQNYHEVYITYPPATVGSYPQPTGNYNQGGSSAGSVPSGYPSNSVSNSGGSSYLQPQPALPPVGSSKPNYQVPVSFPNPNYETTNYPAVTSKPLDHYGTATTSIPYPSPSYPSSQTNYPGYPASGPNNPPPSSGYPAPGNGGSLYKPVLPAPTYPVYPATPQITYPSPNYPTYPATGGGSYQSSTSIGGGSYHSSTSTGGGSYHSSTGSSPPVFIFIPKPGYFNTQQKPTNHYKPTATYPAPINYYPAPKPPVFTNTQYYPAPAKPLKPSGVYPPAKPPSTAYGVPKAPKPNPQHHHQHYHYTSSISNEIPKPVYSNVPAGNSYRTDNNINTLSSFNNNNLGLDDYSKSRQPFDYQGQVAVNPSGLKPTRLANSAQPNLFQRGNQRPADSQTTFSAVVNDFTAFPEAASQSIDQTGRLPFTKKNLSWPTGEESSQVVTVTELPNTLNDVSNFRDDRGRFQSRQPHNDCGGSWVVLDQPGYVDPTQVKVEPIFPPFGKFLDQDFNDQLFESPDEQRFVTFPPFTTLVDQNSKIEIPNNNYLIFSTTPSPNYRSTSEAVTGLWRKPNSLATSPLTFFPSRSIPAEGLKTTGQIVTSRITIKPGFTASHPTSTDNSIILNDIDNLRNDFEFQSIEPSPFLTVISSSDSESDTTETNLVPDRDDPVTLPSIDDTEKLINLLRSANLRALSSLIRQAGITPLLQEKEFTLIAPSNAAFREVSSRQRQRWTNRPESMREMLLYHIIPGHHNSSSFENEAIHITMAGSRTLRINIYNASETRDSVTTVNGARVLTPDLQIGNLLVHVVDRVILPADSGSRTILEILNDGGLQASLLGPALSTVLSSDTTPLTVFVPTTEAFLSVSQDERNLFLNNETAFHNLLWYHIVPGTYYTEGLEDGQWLSTLHSVGRLRVELLRQNRKSKLEKINGEAQVIESDVSASNGVVHFIDRILTDILF